MFSNYFLNLEVKKLENRQVLISRKFSTINRNHSIKEIIIWENYL